MVTHGNTDDTPGASPPKPRATTRAPVVLQVLPALETGGVERGAVDIAQGLTDGGWTALVASEGGRLERDLGRVGARHVTLPLATKAPLALRRNAGRLADLIHARGVSLIHARSRAPAWSALWAARATGIPLVTTFHGTYGRGPLGMKIPYNRVMTLGDRVIAISWFIAEHVRTHYATDPGIIRVVPRGVDLARFAPEVVSSHRIARLATAWRLPEDAKVVLLPGRLTRWKGQALLIEAMARLARPDVRCLLVGSDQGRAGYRADLEELVRRHGLTAQVHILDHCDDMPAAYRLASVVVSASTEPEAFGRVPAEAQAMGRVVLAPRHGGAREIVENGVTGWLFEPGNPASLADHLVLALDLDVATRDAVTRRGMAHTRQTFSKATMIRRTMATYKELLYGAPPLETIWRGHD
ncbi:glycosyltransferase family 4 protein [Roseospira visakhapatnamensis]|uniref:Glycosyltransferase involved in cell wall biosynthesis n=1 Tax=Roseospira visakhapatnamensis TaxID=390880 RepID=A0A7W6WB28_9PROT|nr:glycosyltransferase involved in cell wall biosynthesis [Roseospira visakhapatnamensis]